MDRAGSVYLNLYFLKQSSVKWSAVATVYATAECVGVRKAGRELCVSRRLATLCAAKMESARRESVSVTKDGRESTATLVSGLDRIHTHTRLVLMDMILCTKKNLSDGERPSAVVADMTSQINQT